MLDNSSMQHSEIKIQYIEIYGSQ